jgi:hypothetical protein
MNTIFLLINVLVNVWLLIIVHRQNVRKRLPWFASYIAWEAVSACFSLAFWLSNRQQYPALYWSFEAVEITLIVGSVRESFLRIFDGFTSIAGFRWLVSVVIGIVVAYSAWKTIYAPPLHSTSQLAAFVAGTESLFRWGVAAIALLTVIMEASPRERVHPREDAVVTGFGFSSLTFLLYIGSFSVFPKQYIFMFQYLSSVGYFLAAFWWIWVFSRPVREIGLKDLKEMGLGREAP